jgi:hypothetical protein
LKIDLLKPKLTEDDIDMEKAQRAHEILQNISTIIRGSPESRNSNKTADEFNFLHEENQNSVETKQQTIR